MATNNMPWGDAFLVQTPTLDRWSQQLYQEQKIRQVKQQQEDAALDASIQKEIGKVRSVDTPEVIKAYNDYKQGKKQLLFNKELQKDPLAYNQAQQKVLQDYQRVFTTANKSAELKDMQKQLSEDRIKNPNAYSDDFGQRMATLMNTPISGVGQHETYGDLTNWDNYRYKGSNTNFADILQKGIGQSKQVYSKEEPLDKGLQTKITPYMYGNTPGQVKDYVLGVMAMHQAGRDAAYQWDHTPEKEIDETIKAYQALPKDYWERIGLPGPQDLMPKNPDNKAENYASLMAMKYAISNAPKEGTPVYRENKAAVMAAQEAKEKRMQVLRHADAKDLIDYKKKIDPNDTELNNVWYESYLDKVMSDAKQTGERHHVYNPKTGESELYYNMIKPDPFLLKSLSIGSATPDRVGVTESGEVIPIFIKYDKDGNVVKTKAGTPALDENYSQPMTREQALVNMGYRGSTKKQLKEDQQKIQNKAGAKTNKGASKQYQYDGKVYTHAQLNKLGYDDNEIDQAIKAGIIK